MVYPLGPPRSPVLRTLNYFGQGLRLLALDALWSLVAVAVVLPISSAFAVLGVHLLRSVFGLFS